MVLPRTDPKDAASAVEAEAAEVFKGVLERVKGDREYLKLAERHRQVLRVSRCWRISANSRRIWM